MAIEGLDAGEELAVVADGDEDLGVRAHGGLEDGEGAGGEFVFFELGDFVFPVLLTRVRNGACRGSWGGNVRELVARLGEEFSGGTG